MSIEVIHEGRQQDGRRRIMILIDDTDELRRAEAAPTARRRGQYLTQLYTRVASVFGVGARAEMVEQGLLRGGPGCKRITPPDDLKE